jgi:hypothetical protein
MTYRVATFGTDADGTIVANHNEFTMQATPCELDHPKSVMEHFINSHKKLLREGYYLTDSSEVTKDKYDCGDKWWSYQNVAGDIRTVAIWWTF